MALFPRVCILLTTIAVLSGFAPRGTASGAQPAALAPETGTDPGAYEPVPLLEIELRSPSAWPLLTGLDLDFMEVRPGRRARVLGWPGVLNRLRAAGIETRLITSDYGGDLARRNRDVSGHLGTPKTTGQTSSSAAGASVPPLGLGSLAGFWTFAEVAALLDSVSTVDSLGLVSEVDTLGWSVEGRPILALGVTDHSRPLGTRPEVLYTALTHAREPEGMQVVLYFLLRLLEGYGVDQELTYLVRERELWFVPVVNPDGYVRNQLEWENTGSFGFWRKNLRNNDQNPNIGNNDGVDLNRNFGFQWGYDNVGSSPNISSQTYRGPAAFSEPETQALRDFCLAHAFRTAENYHTYFEACLYPWGYISADTPDSDRFLRLADAMIETARYAYGRSGQVLYAVNGEANDWMYGDAAKPPVMAFTTEVGDQNDGFWPPPGRILPLAEENFRANVILAYGASVYLTADSLTVEGPGGVIRPGEARVVRFRLRHGGVADFTAGTPVARAVSLSPEVSVLDDEIDFPVLGPGEAGWPSAGGGIVLRADPDAVPGTPIRLLLEIADLGAYVGRDTLTIRLGEPLVIFEADAASGLAGWTTQGTWGMETVLGNPVFSDSPGGTYLEDQDASLTLDHPLDLSGGVNAVLRFRTQWDIETGYDFALVEASTDSGATWTAIPGRHTRGGHGTSGSYDGGTQPAGVPGLDGNQRFWEDEEFDLGSYVGLADLRLRFRLTSDPAVEKDGWLLDDLVVLAYASGTALAVGPEASSRPPRLAVSPNPLREGSVISFRLASASPIRLAVLDLSGREVKVLSEGLAGPGPRDVTWDGRDARNLPVASGAYFLRLETSAGIATSKLLVLR